MTLPVPGGALPADRQHIALMQVCNRGALRLAVGARVPGRSEPIPLMELQPGGRAWLPVLRPEPGLLSFRPARGTAPMLIIYVRHAMLIRVL